jgi:hypothetical protein
MIVDKVFVFFTFVDNLAGDYFKTNTISSGLFILYIRCNINHLFKDK